MIRPPRLRPGSVVSLVAPAGPLADGAVDRAAERVGALGWSPLIGRNARSRSGYLAGSDEARLSDLQAAVDSRENDAIWCLRGGYGTMRLLPALNLGPLLERPRAVIGFSDNTALHLSIQRKGLVSFHGPHPAAPELPPFATRGLDRILTSADPAGQLPLPDGHPRPRTLVPGSAEGQLTGGNLSLLAATVGTPFQIRTAGRILFIEEVGEPAYRVDRLLSQLLLAGCLDDVAGVAVGAISDCPDAQTPGLPRPAEVVLDRLERLRVPIVFGFPFGHVAESWTLPMGVSARLDAFAGTLTILKPATDG
ncbi:MAG: LD-carboxypeptidase [Gemmatimonadota bacterium]